MGVRRRANKKRLEAQWTEASDVDAVIALIRADDPAGADDPELRRLLEANAAITDPAAEVAGYPRLSEFRLERQGQGGDIGIVRQAKDILYKANGERLRVTRWYVDNDFTASDPARPRPSYTKMFGDLQLGMIQGFIAYDLIRLYRQYREFQALLDLVDDRPKGAVRIFTSQGDVNLTTPQGRLLAGFWVLVGAMESANISTRVRGKVSARAEAGLWHGGNLPFGYRRIEGKPGFLDQEPLEAAAIRRAAELLIGNGGNLMLTCRQLRLEGHRRRAGDIWHPSSLRAMLLNPMYAGIRRHQPRQKHGRRPAPGELERRYESEAWPAILTPDQAAILKVLLTNPKRNHRPGHGSVRTYMASGLITCGREGCGGVVGSRPRHYASGVIKRSYACRSCHISRDAEAVEERILALLWERHARDPKLDQVIVSALNFDEVDIERLQAAEALANIDRDLERNKAEFEAGKISMEDWIYGKGVLAKRRRELEDKVRARPVDSPIRREHLENWESLTIEERYTLLEAFLDAGDYELVLMPRGKGHANRGKATRDAGLVLRKRAAPAGSESPAPPAAA